MTLHSRFRFWGAFLPIELLLLVTGLIAFVIDKLFEMPSLASFGIFVFLAFLISVFIWIVSGELRTKVVKMHIEGEKVAVSNYFGLGPKRVYSFSQLDGLETALLPSRYGTYEYLYLIENGKKVVKLSQFYHSNYADLKNTLTGKVRNLGQKGFSYIQEFKDIFT